MKKRGANNTGTIRQRKRDGLWEARVTIGVDEHGKTKRKSVYGRTQEEARKKMQALIVEVDKGTYTEPSKITLGAWMNQWYEVYCVRKLKPATLESYRGIIDRYITPALGKKRLQALRGIDVQRFYNSMTDNDLSPKTVKNAGAVLHKALGVAVKEGMIPANPCNTAELPRMVRREIRPLTDAQIPLFLQAIKGDDYENAFAVCLFTGMREGEALGLSWDHVDFEKQTITVCQQLQRAGGQYTIVPFTKSNKPRTIQPPPICFEYLARQQAWQKEQAEKSAARYVWNNPDNLVFTSPLGGHIIHMAFWRHFKRIVTEIGRPDARPHDLRHTAATVAIASGADIKSVQDMLGHASVNFTLNIYAHASDRMRADTAARVQGYYDGLKSKE